MACLGKAAALADFVVWDARRLPLRDGVADAVFGDLPFAGSKAIRHQTPHVQPASVVAGKTASGSYRTIMSQAVRVLRSGGCAVMLSADPKALAFGVCGFKQWVVRRKCNINLGGILGKIFVTERLPQVSKDLNLWHEDGDSDLSAAVFDAAVCTCSGWVLDEQLQLRRRDTNVGRDAGTQRHTEAHSDRGTQRHTETHSDRGSGGELTGRPLVYRVALQSRLVTIFESSKKIHHG